MKNFTRTIASLFIAASAVAICPTLAVGQVNKPKGEAVLKIIHKSDKVQISNFGANSFQLTNTGEKDIVEFELDVTHALFPDSVFDPQGVAGDSVAKPLQINTNGATGIIMPKDAKKKTYIGAGGARGYEGLRITFNREKDNGFNPGETLGFCIDMDPNSVAGTEKGPIDKASAPKWDVGGVSGAELIGSFFTVTFADGSWASGQVFSTANQGGSQGIATQQPTEAEAWLKVNGLKPGGVGQYSAPGPKIQVSGEKGRMVRIVVAKGFIQPVSAYNQELHKQLELLTEKDFPANNAVEFQFLDLEMTGAKMDVSDQFDFSKIKQYDFKADPEKPFSIDEDKVSLAIVAAVIDPKNESMLLGPVTEPIYLRYK